MPFIDESHSFVHGFECGTIWQKLENKSRLRNYLIHLENSAQLQMICDYFEVKCFIKRTDDTYGELTTHYTSEEGDEFI
jgi:hypothetical protein